MIVKSQRILVAAMVFLESASGYAATYYVSTTGNNGNDGSISSPWADIRYGVVNMAANDTLIIRGGTYGGYLFAISEHKSGTGANYTTVKNYPGEVVIYRPTFTGNADHGWTLNNKSNIWLEGLIIDLSQQLLGTVVRVSSSEGQSISGNVVLTNMTIAGSARGQGLLTSGLDSSKSLLITHCNFYTNGWNGQVVDNPLHQIYIQDSNVTVENCYIYGITNVDGGGYGIHLFNSACTNNIYRNNFITDCPPGGILAASVGGTNTQAYNNVVTKCGYGIEFRYIPNGYVLNNTLVSNSTAIKIGKSTNCYVENNIVTGGRVANPGGVYVTDSSDTIFVRNNLGYSNDYADFAIVTAYNVITNGNLFGSYQIGGTRTISGYTLDAKFVNAAAGDFRPGVNSSAIGAGQPQTLFSTDYNRNPRTGWDIGAWDYRIPPPTEFRMVGP